MVQLPIAHLAAKDHGRMGPRMRALTKRQRLFVGAMLDTGMVNHTRCALLAGYTGAMETMRVTAHRLAHDEKVQAAIQEESRRRMQSGTPMAVAVLLGIAQNPVHKDQFKAAIAVLDRSGLHAISESKTTYEHTFDEKAAIAKVRDLCAQTGQDPQKLLAAYGIALDAVDADYTEVTGDGTEGLEDLL